jgi:hypothetical protein
VRVCPKCGLPRRKLKPCNLGSAIRSPGVGEDDWFLEQNGFAAWEFRALNFRDLR